ncbi:MAG: HIT domain-containing protein [candidate division Zixibacteria bacterium]|nr:HIT domain-containing protein [candidate division Zixibacteria bacterium]
MPSIFTRIINREISAKIFHETGDVIVIADINPKEAVHLLIIPKAEYRNFFETPADVIALLDQAVKDVATKLGIEDHFRVQINNGFGQEVEYLHYHFMSDRGAERLKFKG